jgi:hypothetical protein
VKSEKKKKKLKARNFCDCFPVLMLYGGKIVRQMVVYPPFGTATATWGSLSVHTDNLPIDVAKSHFTQ